MRRATFLFLLAPILAGCAARPVVTLPPWSVAEREYLSFHFSLRDDLVQRAPRARIFVWGACEDERVCRVWTRDHDTFFAEHVQANLVIVPELHGRTTVIVRFEDVRTGLLDEARLELTVTPSAELRPLAIGSRVAGYQSLLLSEAPAVFRTPGGLPFARCTAAEAEYLERDLPIRATVDRARIHYFRCLVANEIEPGRFFLPSNTTEQVPQREVAGEFVACVLTTERSSAVAIRFAVTDSKGWRVLPEGLGAADSPVCKVIAAQHVAQ